MAEPHWTSYVGMVSGIVGVIVASYSLYKTSKIKALDLRLELKRAVVDLDSLYEELEDILARAKKSRESMSAAMGRYNSGGMKHWMEEHSKDEIAWKDMKIKLLSKESTYESLNSEELEKKLVEIHEHMGLLQSMKNKYLASMKQDAKNGEFIREQAHKQVQNHT